MYFGYRSVGTTTRQVHRENACPEYVAIAMAMKAQHRLPTRRDQ